MADVQAKSAVQHIDLMCCPGCGGNLSPISGGFACVNNCRLFHVVDDIPRFFWPNAWDSGKDDVTERMKSFYEETPFPNYDDCDTVARLMEKARRGLFAKLLDEQIPFGTRIIECGCGTGQLTNFLSVANRTVFGTDMCLNSLRLAHDFKKKNGLDRAHFYQMNIFQTCFKPGNFDLVISNGVLHHTSDPFLAFRSIARLVRPKGYILIGLYHKYGRLITDFRRFLFNLTNDRWKFLDRHAVDRKISAAKRRSWFMDQYKNPHESKHTVGEVLGWLKDTGFTFVRTIPQTVPFAALDEGDELFRPDRLGNRLERFMADIERIFRGQREGGLFIVIARKATS